MKVIVWDPNNAWKYEVDRNLLQRIFYPRDFATLNESLRRYDGRVHWWDRPLYDWFMIAVYTLVGITLAFVIYIMITVPPHHCNC